MAVVVRPRPIWQLNTSAVSASAAAQRCAIASQSWHFGACAGAARQPAVRRSGRGVLRPRAPFRR